LDVRPYNDCFRWHRADTAAEGAKYVQQRLPAMSLVLAIRCKGGVVLASDGQATTEAAGQPTRQPVRKLFDIAGRIAWGAAGAVGLQQALEEAVAGLDPRRGTPEQLRQHLVSLVIPIQQRAVTDWVPHPGAHPPDLACIFCWWQAARPWILSIPRTGSDHQFHDTHAAIGSGDIFADFAMVSVAHLDTPELALEEAKMVAFKAISDAIDVAAVFLGPPIQMYVVRESRVESVPREELEGALADSVDAWKARQRESIGPLASVDHSLQPSRGLG
jgi:20S proteasome alpha/beta subunit